MKYFLFVTYLISVQFCFGQSELSTPESDCKFILPWVCNECSFNWTGECVNNLPSGNGVLTVFNESEEIMKYEGQMKNGYFDGKGKYQDGMSKLDGYL
jgi:hypothetical protein